MFQPKKIIEWEQRLLSESSFLLNNDILNPLMVFGSEFSGSSKEII